MYHVVYMALELNDLVGENPLLYINRSPQNFPVFLLCWCQEQDSILNLWMSFIFFTRSDYRVGAAVSVNIKFTLVGNFSEFKRCFSSYPIGFEETQQRGSRIYFRKRLLTGVTLPEGKFEQCSLHIACPQYIVNIFVFFS